MPGLPVLLCRSRGRGATTETAFDDLGEDPMARTRTSSRLSQAAVLGLRELPTNTAWLIGKALQPANPDERGATNLGTRVAAAAQSAADSAATSVAEAGRKVSGAGRLVADAVPAGHESVSRLMQRADEAAEQAQELEGKA